MSALLCDPSFNKNYNEPLTMPNSPSNGCNGAAIVVFMTILETLLQKSCKIIDPRKRVVPKKVPDEEYDFIVVGGGVSGSVVAGRLAEAARENSWKILLIEAGRDEPAYAQVPFFQNYTVGSDIDWQFKTEETEACLATEGKCTWPRGKVLGGSGILNAMVYLRATRKDAERWVKAGNTDWTYEELLRLYKKSEDNRETGTVVSPEYHSRGGPWTIQRFNYVQKGTLDMLKAVQQVGYNIIDDLNGDVSYGFAVYQASTRNGQRLSTAQAYLRPQRKNPHLHVMINSTVNKLIIDQSNEKKRATGVELTYKNKTYKVKATKEVILAAGAIQTPQLLLLSGIGDKEELDKVNIEQIHDLPGVGRGLQDHLGLYITYTTNQNTSRLTWTTVAEYAWTEGGPMSAYWMHNMLGRINSSYSTQDDPDGQLYSHTANAAVWCENPGNKPLVIIPSLNQPKSKGYVTLRTSNISDPPKIVANYFSNQTDVKIMIEFIRISQKVIESPIIQKKFQPKLNNQSYYDACSKSSTFDSDKWWECVLRYGSATIGHPSCTCKMGPASNPEACVDQQLQLHGIENVRIVDASVFPSIVSANLQATVVAVAEKGAELIITKYLNSL